MTRPKPVPYRRLVEESTAEVLEQEIHLVLGNTNASVFDCKQISYLVDEALSVLFVCVSL